MTTSVNITVLGYETEEDVVRDSAEHIDTVSCEEEATRIREEYEDKGYYLVTTTNDNGKLIS